MRFLHTHLTRKLVYMKMYVKKKEQYVCRSLSKSDYLSRVFVYINIFFTCQMWMFIIITLKTVTTYNNHKVRKVDKRFIASIVDHFEFFMEKKTCGTWINDQWEETYEISIFYTVFLVKYRQLNIRVSIDTHCTTYVQKYGGLLWKRP